MYLKASELFNTLIRETGRTFRAKLICGKESIDSGFISIGIYGGSNNGDTITIGSTISQRIEVEMHEPDISLSKKEWELQIGLLVDGELEEYEYIPVGLFVPEKVKTDNGKTSFTAYDRMLKLSGVYTCSLTTINTLNVLNDISVKTGVPIDTTGLTAIPMAKPEGYTSREVLMYISQLYGKFANVNREGMIELHWWTEVEGYEVTPDDTNGFLHDEKIYTLGNIICAIGVVEETEDEDGNINENAGETISISTGNGTQGISISNPFMTQQVLDNVYKSIGGFTYTVSNVNCLAGDVRLDPWDIVTVVDKKGNSYKVPLMTLDFKYDGGVSASFSCVGYSEEETENDFKGPMKQFEERLIAKVAYIEYLTAKKASIDDLEALTIKVNNITAGTITTDYLEANYVSLNHLSANYINTAQLNATFAKISDIEASYIKADTIEAEYARLDKTNIEDGWITTAMIGTGVVGTAQIADGSITDAKIVSLTANKLSAGIIDAAQIEVINLNCANLTVGTINGQQIAAGAIDTSKLSESLNTTITTTAEDVEQALAGAGVAMNKADSATSTASAAQMVADSAASTANAAQTVAAAAQSTANAAKTAASAAQTTADGKNTVFYQTSAPPTSGRKTNDVWFDTDDGNKMYYWDGTKWTEKQFGTNAIANAAITNALIADATIQSAKIANLDAGKITAGYISADRIASSTITSDKIAANAVTAAKILAGAVDSDKLAANSVIAGKIAANAVTSDTIASSVVTTDKLSANAVTATKIAADAITSDKIVSNAITAAKIAGGAITSDKIATNAITAAKINVESLEGLTIVGLNIIGTTGSFKKQIEITSENQSETLATFYANEETFAVEYGASDTGDTTGYGALLVGKDAYELVGHNVGITSFEDLGILVGDAKKDVILTREGTSIRLMDTLSELNSNNYVYYSKTNIKKGITEFRRYGHVVNMISASDFVNLPKGQWTILTSSLPTDMRPRQTVYTRVQNNANMIVMAITTDGRVQFYNYAAAITAAANGAFTETYIV